MKYFRNEASITYGTLLSAHATWTFDDSSSLIGIRGYMDGTIIKQLGFLVYSTDTSLCPELLEEEEAETAEEETPEDTSEGTG